MEQTTARSNRCRPTDRTTRANAAARFAEAASASMARYRTLIKLLVPYAITCEIWGKPQLARTVTQLGSPCRSYRGSSTPSPLCSCSHDKWDAKQISPQLSGPCCTSSRSSTQRSVSQQYLATGYSCCPMKDVARRTRAAPKTADWWHCLQQ